MKIALCSSVLHTTPPIAYGSEVTCWYMCEELCKRGHEVHLIATEESGKPANGELHTLGPADNKRTEMEKLIAPSLLDVLSSCDLVHDMSSSHGFADLAHREGTDKHLTTINGISFVTPRYKHNVVVVSEAARRAALTDEPAWDENFYQFMQSPGLLPSAEVVHYGTDTDFYSPCYKKEDYIVYIGRPDPSKGVDWILKLAEAMPKERFILAWRADHANHVRYEAQYSRVAKNLPNAEIKKLPIEGHHEAKRELYQHAKAFIQPTQYVEAFGLTAIEALSCATPVILMDKGSAPEIVDSYHNGFLCKDLEGFQLAIENINKISSQHCRVTAEIYFSKSVMCDKYLKLYERTLRGEEW